MAHLEHQQISAFLAGALSTAELDGVEAHLDACDECRRLTSEVVRQRLGRTAASAAPTDVVPGGVTLPVAVGEVVDGRYHIERLLGVGGMGCVFEAHQLHLNHRVAMKFMLPGLEGEAAPIDRFLREARSVARLHSPHVCKVIDVGHLPSGRPYLVMELLHGETLESRLQREGPLPPKVAVHFIREALQALREAHALGVVHRDLKPANLFLAHTPSGREVLKVLDFGIAKSAHPDIEQGLAGSTTTTTLLGSPQYMAPEQLLAGPVDARVDLWALGCVLFQVLTGQVPFRGETLVDLMYAIQRRPHPALATLRRGVPTELVKVVDRCLAKEPRDRFATAASLDAALQRVEAPTSFPSIPGPPRWGLAAAILTAVVLALSTTLLLMPESAGEAHAAPAGPALAETKNATSTPAPLFPQLNQPDAAARAPDVALAPSPTPTKPSPSPRAQLRRAAPSVEVDPLEQRR